ncbi:MAG: S8 family peptidase [Bacteriovoracaceae bacterium]|nr:S8 family peptidase [Bacteriovoracaceae bacterium]
MILLVTMLRRRHLRFNIFCLFLFATFASKSVAIENSINKQFILKLDFGPSQTLMMSRESEQALQNKLIARLSKQAKVEESLDLIAGKYLVVTPKTTKANFLKSIQEESFIAYSEPNQELKLIKGVSNESQDLRKLPIGNIPIDASFGLLWGLDNTGKNIPDRTGKPSEEVGVAGNDIGAIKAWDISMGSKKIKIAIIDTGIDYNHPDLKDNIWINEAEANGIAGVDDDNNGIIDDLHGANFSVQGTPTGDPLDDHNHGTHCAGTIAGVHNDIGVAGVMAEASLVAVKFLSSGGGGSTDAAMRSIDYATKLKVNVMSNSWGGGGFSQALFDVIKQASDQGIVFVAAAGNSSLNNDAGDFYPANYKVDSLISVAATNAQDELASFSNFGAKTVHVAAPGHRILSTVIGNKYAVSSGTSMATPHVSGIVGLLLAANPNLNAKDIKRILIETSTKTPKYTGKVVAEGRVNAFDALTEATARQ